MMKSYRFEMKHLSCACKYIFDRFRRYLDVPKEPESLEPSFGLGNRAV